MLTKLNTVSRAHKTCHFDRSGANSAVHRAMGTFILLGRSLDWMCDQKVQLHVLQLWLSQEML